MNSPRNNQQVTRRDEQVAMQGAVTKPGQTVWLQQRNQRRGRWDALSDGFTSAENSPFFTDANGFNWYRYNRPATLRAGNDYWKLHSNGSQRKLATELRTIDPNTNTALVSYDAGSTTNDCIASNYMSGGSAVINNCRSSSSPVAKVVVDCGKDGQECCIANDVPESQACDTGNACRTSDIWALDLNQLKVINRTEGPGGDEVMLAVIPFRMTIRKQGCGFSVDRSIIGWNEVLHRLDGRKDVNGGHGPLSISDPNGRVHFSDIELRTNQEANAGLPFDVVGAVMIGIENDSTDRDVMRSFVRSSMRDMESALISGIESVNGCDVMSSMSGSGECAETPSFDLDSALDQLGQVLSQHGLLQALEATVEGIIGQTDDVLSAQVRMWFGFGNAPNNPIALATDCQNVDGTVVEVEARMFGHTTFTLDEPGLDFRHGHGTNWRAAGAFFNLSNALWPQGKLTCSEAGSNPHFQFNDAPQHLSSTTYQEQASVF
jgi:hypothetical protein